MCRAIFLNITVCLLADACGLSKPSFSPYHAWNLARLSRECCVSKFMIGHLVMMLFSLHKVKGNNLVIIKGIV